MMNRRISKARKEEWPIASVATVTIEVKVVGLDRAIKKASKLNEILKENQALLAAANCK
jgi:hypothetical protein